MRYLPLSSDDRFDMLARIGVETIDDLFADAPRDALLKAPLDLPLRKSELEVERRLGRLAAKNRRGERRSAFSSAPALTSIMCRPASII